MKYNKSNLLGSYAIFLICVYTLSLMCIVTTYIVSWAQHRCRIIHTNRSIATHTCSGTARTSLSMHSLSGSISCVQHHIGENSHETNPQLCSHNYDIDHQLTSTAIDDELIDNYSQHIIHDERKNYINAIKSTIYMK